VTFVERDSEIEELVGKGFGRVTVYVDPNESGQFVGILAGGGDADRPRPVVVQVGQFVRKALNVVRLQASKVHDDIEGGWCDGALSD